MRLVADESVDRSILNRLRRDGFDVLAIAKIAAGSADEDVLARAVAERALLLTADKDFDDLVFRQQRDSVGVVLLRLSGLAQEARARLVSQVFQEHADRPATSFTVIERGGVRLRKPFI